MTSLYWRSFATAIFLVLILQGCKKPESDIGLELQDGLLTTQSDTTVNIAAFVVRIDSLKTDSLSSNLCGIYEDPIFGKTEASMAFNISPSTSIIEFGDPADLIIDSMILSMKYTGYYYGALNPQHFSIREVVSDFNTDNDYYSDDFPELGEEEFMADPLTSYEIDTQTDVLVGDNFVDPQIRLDITPSLGEKWVEARFNEEWTDQESFLDYFHGLNVRSETVNGAVVGYDVKDFDSKITMYYRNTVDEDTLEYVFFINEDEATLTNFWHHYQGETFDLNGSSEIDGSENIYVQAGASLQTRLELPEIEDVLGSGASVNKAELVVPVNSADIDRFEEPVSLVLVQRDENDEVVFLPDETAFSTYDGLNNEYRFNISQHIQKVISGNSENSPLYLIALSSGVSVNRVSLRGPQYNPDEILQNLRLEITYTR